MVRKGFSYSIGGSVACNASDKAVWCSGRKVFRRFLFVGGSISAGARGGG